MLQEDRDEVGQPAIGGLAAGDRHQRYEGGYLLPREPFAGFCSAMGDAGDEIRPRPGDALVDEPVDVRREGRMRLDAVRPARLLTGQPRDHPGGDLRQIAIVVLAHAQDRRDDFQRQWIRQAGDEVYSSAGRQPAEQVVDDHINQRQVIALELATGKHGRDDGAPDVVVVAVHLHHGRTDHVGEDPLVRTSRIRAMVAEDGRHVVVARQQPAVIDGVMKSG